MDILKHLGILDENFGACIGPDAWLKTTSEGRVDSICPATGERIASVHKCSEQDYEKVIQASQKTFLSWRMVPAPKRGELIRLIGQALREKKEELGSLVSLEMGKIKQESLGEVQEMIDMADFAVGLSRQLYGLTMHSERPRHRMYEQWHPLGPVGVISAFNFPVAVWSWNAFIAAVCGDAVIWKPSSSTPLCAIAVQNICNQVLKQQGYPPIFSLMIGDGRTVGERMVSDHRLQLISFTGSTAMGKRVSKIVGERLGRAILELGGNNAIILDRSADLKLAIPAIVFGAVGTAGQRCTSTRRVFVPKEMFSQVTDELIKSYQQVKIGNPLDSHVLMGPLVNHAAVEDYLDGIKRVTEDGGQVLYGGRKINRAGFFVEPTLIKAKNSYPTVQQEIFAPILYLIEYDTIHEAIQQQNAVPQGLSSALFTTNMVNAEKFLSHEGSDCGIANINIGTSGAEIGGAFGGEKETGGGREAGSDAWKAYMRRQTNTINFSLELPLAQGIKFGK